jgi:integrase
MTARRGRGEGGLHWDENRQRWIATVTIGHDGRGKRITRKASGRTKTEAKSKLRELLRDQDDGTPTPKDGYTVADAVTYWLSYGLRGREEATIANYTALAKTHILPALGKRRLRELSAEDVDEWLTGESHRCSTRTLRLLHSILSRSLRHAQARDKVRRNVVLLCDVPTGLNGRPSKALTLSQATAIIKAAAESRLYAYLVLSLLIGARTEELRALRWCHVDLTGRPDTVLPVPPSISVLRSVRAGGDSKTRRSRRALAMPQRCVDALNMLWDQQSRVPGGWPAAVRSPLRAPAAPKTRTPGSAAVVEGHLVAVGVRERESAAERPVDGR